MSVARRVAWNAITKWADGILAGLVQFFLVRFLIDQMSSDGYGLAETVYGIVAFSLIVQLGLRHALGRHLAEQVALKDTRRVNELFSTALVCYSVLAVLLAIGFNLLAEPLVVFLKVPEPLRADGIFLIRFFSSACAILSLIEPAYGAVLFATHRFDLLNYGDIADTVVRATAVFAIVGLTDLGVHGWAIGMLLGAGFATCLKIYFCHRIWPTLRESPRLFRWQAFKELYSLGGLVFLRENVTLLGMRTDPLILSNFLGVGAVAFYKPGMLVVDATAPFVYALVRQFTPMTAELIATGKRQQVQDLLIRGSRMAYLMGGPVCVVFAVFAHRFVENVWLGPGFAVTAWVLIIWTLRTLAFYAGSAQWPLLMGVKEVKFIVTFQLVLAIVNLLSSIALVTFMVHYGWGMTSVIGVVIPTAVLGQIERVVVSIHVARVVGISPLRYFREAYLRPNVVLVLVGAVSLGLIVVCDPTSRAGVLAAMAVAGATALPLGWLIALDADDRRRFLGLVRGKRAKRSGGAPPPETSEAVCTPLGAEEPRA